MYYIYFPFVFILSGLTFFECRRKKLPKWWAALVFAAPVTAPYFIFKSMKSRGIIPFMIFFFCLTAVAGSEFYLYSQMNQRMKYSHLPPITRQMMRLGETLKRTTQSLDKALVILEHKSTVESRIMELKNTIDFIADLRITMSRNQSAIQQMVKFTRNYKSYFIKKDLNWVHHLQLFYINRNVINAYAGLERYLDDFHALLAYTYKNFDNITKVKSPTHLRNYDEYYLRYRRAVNSHNRLNVKRIQYQNTFLLKYPDTKPYLPGKRQTEAFRLLE